MSFELQPSEASLCCVFRTASRRGQMCQPASPGVSSYHGNVPEASGQGVLGHIELSSVDDFTPFDINHS